MMRNPYQWFTQCTTIAVEKGVGTALFWQRKTEEEIIRDSSTIMERIEL